MADTPTTEQAAVASASAAEPAAAAVAATAAAAAPAAAAQAPVGFKVSLEHFATQLSARDKRVALIHGWVHTEKVAKRFKDLPDNFQRRFEAFATQPV